MIDLLLYPMYFISSQNPKQLYHILQNSLTIMNLVIVKHFMQHFSEWFRFILNTPLLPNVPIR